MFKPGVDTAEILSIRSWPAHLQARYCTDLAWEDSLRTLLGSLPGLNIT